MLHGKRRYINVPLHFTLLYIQARYTRLLLQMFYRYPCRSVAVCRLSQFLTKLDCEQSLSVPRNQSSGRGNTKINWRSRNWLYRKIPTIIPGAYFWSKDLFAKFFFFFGGGGGGGLYSGGLIHGRILAL